MKIIKKYTISLAISIIIFLILLLTITLLNYLNIIKDNITNIFLLIIPIISCLIGSINIGTYCTNKGWFNGVKYGLIFDLFLIIINIIFYKKIILKNIIYYIIFLITSLLGGTIGINKKRKS